MGGPEAAFVGQLYDDTPEFVWRVVAHSDRCLVNLAKSVPLGEAIRHRASLFMGYNAPDKKRIVHGWINNGINGTAFCMWMLDS